MAMKNQKEAVAGPWAMLWKAMAVIAVILLMGMAFHQAAKSTTGRKSLHGGGAHRQHVQPRAITLCASPY
jgi:hypothetical protein